MNMQLRNRVFIGGVIVTAVIALYAYNEATPETPAEVAAATARAQAATASKAAASNAAQREYYAAQGAIILQGMMRNPDSFKVTAVGDMKNGALCYEYRSQNGFGGMTAGRAAMVHNHVDVGAAAWKKSCGGKDGADITAGAISMIDLARSSR